MAELMWQDNLRSLYCGDARVMADIPDSSVQCVVTSPPYWGPRNYAGEQDLIWDGDPGCRHRWGPEIINYHRADEFKTWANSAKYGKPYKTAPEIISSMGRFCEKCDAWKGAYGREPTPELYIRHSITFLREIHRVLRKDGVVFWNIGDGYYSSPSNQQGDRSTGSKVGVRSCRNVGRVRLQKHPVLKRKDLCLIPERFAIAAQEDGWWVRCDVIWYKPNGLPSSATDRPARVHEYIYILSKRARYYWDQEGALEPYDGPINRWGGPHFKGDTVKTRAYKDMLDIGKTSALRPGQDIRPNPAGRYPRSVWNMPVSHYSDEHFAVFPEELPERAIKAATPEAGCCPECGAPWKRVVKTKKMKLRRTDWGARAGTRTGNMGMMEEPRESETVGWRPTCKCVADKPCVPATVLDPFAGSGTTLLVASRMSRRSIGYELSSQYCHQIMTRNAQGALLLMGGVYTVDEKQPKRRCE